MTMTKQEALCKIEELKKYVEEQEKKEVLVEHYKIKKKTYQETESAWRTYKVNIKNMLKLNPNECIDDYSFDDDTLTVTTNEEMEL